MHVLLFFLVAVLCLRTSEGVWILPEGSKYFAVVGENVTFHCVTPIGDGIRTLKWYFGDLFITRCRSANLSGHFPGASHSEKACSLAIAPVEVKSSGLYTCKEYDGTLYNSATVQLQVVDNNPTMDLIDLSSGAQVGNHDTSPLCVQPAKQTFECTIRDTTPDVWNIKWILGDSEEDKGSTRQTTNTGGLANVSSRYTVYNSKKDGHLANLTCQASGLGNEFFNVAVLLQFCSGGDNTVLIVTVTAALSSLLTAATVLAVVRVLRLRITGASSSIQQHTQSTEPTVAMNVTSEEASVTQVQRKYEDRITQVERKALDKFPPNVLGKYEHRITQIESVQEDELTPQMSRKYEDRITRSVLLRKYEDRITQQEVKPLVSEDNLPPWAERWTVPWSDVVIDERVLGSGNFGEVRSGAVKIYGEMTSAAIKMLKGHASTSERADFVDELRTMTSVGYHANIVSLLGACQHHDVLYVALEYLPHGDLRSYLRTARSQSDSDKDALSSDQLVKFALDVAKGMEHLARVGVIHRDLAARNILLGDGLVAKVSDFGLSRGEDIYVQTSNKRVPIRWLAVESVRYHKYTTKSDVWSFGILLWEIATLGGTPYPSIKSDSLAAKLKKGYRMTKPSNCDERSYALMRECWEEDPKKRPTFTDLVSVLSDMADNKIKHTYMSLARVHYDNLSAIHPELDDN